MCNYDNTDFEKGQNLVQLNKKVEKEMKKKEKPSVKSRDVFEGWREKQKKKNKAVKRKGLSRLNFEKRQDAYTKQ